MTTPEPQLSLGGILGHEVFPGITLVRLLGMIAIIAVGIPVAYIIRRIAYRTLARFLPKEAASAAARIIYYGLAAAVIVSAFGAAGVDLTGVVIAGGILGIILGFALQSITANLVSGLFIFWERPLKPGDIVEVEGVIGRVVDITIMSTIIMDFNGIRIRIPNAKVYDSVIKNYISTAARRLEFKVSIAYKEDAEKAYQVIKNVLDNHPLVLVEPEPDIFVSNLGDSGVDITVRCWAPTSEWYPALKDLLWRLKKALSDAGIEIPFPQSDIWFRSPLEVRLVSGEREESLHGGRE